MCDESEGKKKCRRLSIVSLLCCQRRREVEKGLLCCVDRSHRYHMMNLYDRVIVVQSLLRKIFRDVTYVVGAYLSVFDCCEAKTVKLCFKVAVCQFSKGIIVITVMQY